MITRHLLRGIICTTLFVTVCGSSHAEDSGTPTPSPTVTVDALPSLASVSGGAASDYLALADALKKFEDGSLSEVDREATKRECLALITAIQLGESSQSERCAALSASITSDLSYSSRDRFNVAASLQHLKSLAKESNYSDKGAKFTDLENIERSLLASYPDVDGAYEALLHVGESTPDSAQAARIGADLSKLLRAPQWVHLRAEALNERIQLIGKSLPEILSRYADRYPELSVASTTSYLVYSWSSSNETSRVLAKKYADLAPKGALVIGICLDESSNPQSNLQLPGIQINDGQGINGALAKALMLTHAPLAYLTDSGGQIVNVLYASELQQM